VISFLISWMIWKRFISLCSVWVILSFQVNELLASAIHMISTCCIFRYFCCSLSSLWSPHVMETQPSRQL
jgi:hypothetical protein